MKKTLYEFLGIEPDATPEEIKAAAQYLAKKFHPSKYPGNPRVVARFKKIKQVYNTLANPQKRAAYDAILAKRMVETKPTPTSSQPKPEHRYPTQSAKEQIIYRAYVHWIGYIKALLLIGIATYLLTFNELIQLNQLTEKIWFIPNHAFYLKLSLVGLLLLGILTFIHTLLMQLTTTLMITHQQIVAQVGLISKQSINMAPAQFEHLEIQQSLLGKILKFGTLKLRGTKGRGIGGISIKINHIAAPQQFEKQLIRFINKNAYNLN